MDLLHALMFLAGAATLSGLRRVSDIPRRRRALSDLLPWAFVVSDSEEAAGVVLNKDGSFTAALSLGGPDRASSTDEELNNLSTLIARAFTTFTDSWTFHLTALRRPAHSYPAAGDFPDPVTRLLDDLRREEYLHGNFYETAVVLVVTFRPPREIYHQTLLRLQQGVKREQHRWEDVLDHFRQQFEVLASRLAGPLRVTPLSASGLLTHLHECLTSKHHPVAAPPAGRYLDLTLASEPFLGGWEPRIGEVHLRILGVTGLPATTTPALLNPLNDLPFPYRFTTRLIPLSTPSAQRIISRQQRGWSWDQQSAASLFRGRTLAEADPFRNRHASAMVDEAADATRLNQEADVRFFLTTPVVVLGDSRPDRATQNARQMKKLLEDRGFTCRLETVNAVAAFHGSLPAVARANLRAPLIHGLAVADILPLTAIWPGLESNPSRFFPAGSPSLLIATDQGATPFRLHLHTGDLGHTIIVGPPGSGKSTLLQALATGWLRYPRSRVVLFDRDRSSLLLARAANAAYYDLGGSEVALQPLRHLDSESDRAGTLSWLEALFAVQLPAFTAQNRNVVAAALTRLAHLEPSHRTLSMLKLQLQDVDLAAALEPFTDTGPYGSYLGASHETLDVARFQIFEMATLFGLEPKIQLPILWYLLTRLELQLDGSPTLILLDEAGLALLHTYFSEVIKEWALRLRKKNCVLVLAVQTLAQLTQNDSFNTLLESCPTRIFLPNPAASSHAVAGFYRACNLNDKQIQRIAESRPKRDYYFVNPDGSRLMELALTPADLGFYSTVPGLSLQATHARMQDTIAQHGPSWPVDWLQQLGLSEASDRLARLYEETLP